MSVAASITDGASVAGLRARLDALKEFAEAANATILSSLVAEPGEKLYEELLMSEEGLQDTANELIHIGHPIEMDDEWFEEKLRLLDKVSRQDSSRIKEIVAEIVPTYHYTK